MKQYELPDATHGEVELSDESKQEGYQGDMNVDFEDEIHGEYQQGDFSPHEYLEYEGDPEEQHEGYEGQRGGDSESDGEAEVVEVGADRLHYPDEEEDAQAPAENDNSVKSTDKQSTNGEASKQAMVRDGRPRVTSRGADNLSKLAYD